MSLAIDRLAHTGRWRARPLTEKALLALGLLGLALALPPWPGAVLVTLAAWGAALLGARVPLRPWLGLTAAPLGFVAAGCLTLAVELGPDGVALAADHGARALGVGLRAVAASSCLLLLAATTPTADLVRGLRRLGLPVELAELMLTCWRFIFVLLDTAAALHAAQAARLGWHGRRRALRSFGLLVAALLPSALERARRLEVGLAARGYDGASLRVLHASAPLCWHRLTLVAAGELALAGGALWLS